MNNRTLQIIVKTWKNYANNINKFWSFKYQDLIDLNLEINKIEIEKTTTANIKIKFITPIARQIFSVLSEFAEFLLQQSKYSIKLPGT
jgi:hypothetical protein